MMGAWMKVPAKSSDGGHSKQRRQQEQQERGWLLGGRDRYHRKCGWGGGRERSVGRAGMGMLAVVLVVLCGMGAEVKAEMRNGLFSTEAEQLAWNKEQIAFLEEKRLEEGIIEQPTGILIKIVQTGERKYFPKKTTSIRVRYQGKLVNGLEFDSTMGEGDVPLAMQLTDRVIPAWKETLKLMAVGDIWEIWVPPDYGYGNQVKSVIPANSVLYFQIHLYDIPNAEQYSARIPPICTLSNMLQTCSGRERAFIEKAKNKYTTAQSVEDAIAKLMAKRSKLTSVASRIPNWEQVAILEQLLAEKVTEDADEL